MVCGHLQLDGRVWFAGEHASEDAIRYTLMGFEENSALDYIKDIIDGEIVALDESGRPNFNLLQNFRSEASRIDCIF